MALAEAGSTPHWLVHAASIALLVGRLAQAVGLSRMPEDLRLRTFGVVLTFTVLSVLALAVLVAALLPGRS